MLKPLVSRFLQHLSEQNQWSRMHLSTHSGKVIRLQVAFLHTDLQILEDGSLIAAPETASPDATIHAPPSLMARILAGDEAAKTQITMEGDAHLATAFGKVLANMRWDIEEDLSRIVGDITAHKSMAASRKIASQTKQQAVNLAEMLAEYWQEEMPLLAKKRHIERFNQEVDALRNDVDRLQKRIEKLSSKLEESALH
jgi:ubiquinone biosynthesis accessory factor UbiJ